MKWGSRARWTFVHVARALVYVVRYSRVGRVVTRVEVRPGCGRERWRFCGSLWWHVGVCVTFPGVGGVARGRICVAFPGVGEVVSVCVGQ